MLGSLFGGLQSPLSQNPFGDLSQLRVQSLAYRRELRSRLASMGMAPFARSPMAVQDVEPVDLYALPHDEIVGEIVAWRAWKFFNGCLLSPYRGTPWKPGETIEAADPTKTSGGIFAHKVREQVFEQENGWDVVGTVLLWGEVVEHENGYRGQYARVGQLLHFSSGMTPSFKEWLKAEFMTE